VATAAAPSARRAEATAATSRSLADILVQNGVANEPTLGAALNTSSNGSSRAASHYLLEQ
jgi:hypothetical protein